MKSNPCFGASVKPEFLEEQYHTMRTKPEQESAILTKNFNLWVQASDIWIGDDVWCACRSETPVESLAGCECYAGLDPRIGERLLVAGAGLPRERPHAAAALLLDP